MRPGTGTKTGYGYPTVGNSVEPYLLPVPGRNYPARLRTRGDQVAIVTERGLSIKITSPPQYTMSLSWNPIYNHMLVISTHANIPVIHPVGRKNSPLVYCQAWS